MGSSNLVKITKINEVSYGVTPVAGNFQTSRYISETLSGSPQTVESKQIRTDRMSSGQITTGLQVQGGINFELAKETVLEDYMASAMSSDWNILALITVDLSYNAGTKLLTRATGSWITDGIVKGDIITLAGFLNTINNTQFMVAQVNSATVVRLVVKGGFTFVTEVGVGTSFKRSDKLVIGLLKKSFSIQKEFTDLTTKAIVYRGMLAATMDLNVTFGELINGSFGFSGNNHFVADAANEFITDGRTVDVPATTDSLNGSIDMPFLANDAVGVFDDASLDLRSVAIALDNNLTPQNVIGDVAPKDYSQGTARINIDLSAYLTNAAWTLLGKRLTQESFALGFMVQNLDGYYGFYMPAIQVSSDDPASAGQDQDIILTMQGQAKVGDLGESALVIYRS
jgi:hypothetical protein